MNFEIRPVTPSGEQFLIKMMVLAMLSLPDLRPRPPAELQIMAHLELSQWQPGRDWAWLAWSGQQPVGGIWLRSNGEINQPRFTLGMAVDPYYQRKGAGRALIGHAIEFCQGYKSCSLNLKVHPDNKPAINLYRQAGFVISMVEMNHIVVQF